MSSVLYLIKLNIFFVALMKMFFPYFGGSSLKSFFTSMFTFGGILGCCNVIK